MDLLMQIFSFLSNEGSDILAALFMVLGGLKVIARYTPFKWDDDVLRYLEAPLRLVASVLGKKKE